MYLGHDMSITNPCSVSHFAAVGYYSGSVKY